MVQYDYTRVWFGMVICEVICGMVRLYARVWFGTVIICEYDYMQVRFGMVMCRYGNMRVWCGMVICEYGSVIYEYGSMTAEVFGFQKGSGKSLKKKKIVFSYHPPSKKVHHTYEGADKIHCTTSLKTDVVLSQKKRKEKPPRHLACSSYNSQSGKKHIQIIVLNFKSAFKLAPDSIVSDKSRSLGVLFSFANSLACLMTTNQQEDRPWSCSVDKSHLLEVLIPSGACRSLNSPTTTDIPSFFLSFPPTHAKHTFHHQEEESSFPSSK
ncbi:hypothetical protein CEXT_639681 [Caerostris extrusa]|uniref:Uncharacterized protein n=1 Tax=Caerostris extrusa TaxID=172846 RepID=A0AAV4ME45_CAEEX|nr:hypothetical protein CEXT_639681 [Caerostris extrusa]